MTNAVKNHTSLKLFTSNEAKLQEYRGFGLPGLEALKGVDIKEVQGTELEVIQYKVLQLPEGTLAEDTSLEIEGAEVGVNIRYMLDNLSEYVGRGACFNVLIGKCDGDVLSVYHGSLHGTIVEPQEVQAGYPVFGFDNCFAPDGGEGHTLYTLQVAGLKDEFSPRKKAIQAVLADDALARFTVSDIPAWTGAYQNE